MVVGRCGRREYNWRCQTRRHCWLHGRGCKSALIRWINQWSRLLPSPPWEQATNSSITFHYTLCDVSQWQLPLVTWQNYYDVMMTNRSYQVASRNSPWATATGHMIELLWRHWFCVCCQTALDYHFNKVWTFSIHGKNFEKNITLVKTERFQTSLN